MLRALRKEAATAAIPVMVVTSLPQCKERKLIEEGNLVFLEIGIDGGQGQGLFVDAVEKMLTDVKAKAKAAGP